MLGGEKLVLWDVGEKAGRRIVLYALSPRRIAVIGFRRTGVLPGGPGRGGRPAVRLRRRKRLFCKRERAREQERAREDSLRNPTSDVFIKFDAKRALYGKKTKMHN